MEYRLLGPLEVLDASGQKLHLGGAMQQSVLASLLLRADHTVALERIVDELWEEPPPTAARTVQAYVSRLRHQLREGAIESRPGGYTLVLDDDELDLRLFEQSAEEGRRALAAGNCGQAAELLRQALALRRGPALLGLTSEALGREAERLEELALRVVEDRIEADLGCGREREIVPELQALVQEHPFRERPRAQLMLALYRAGRQSDALAFYRETRSLLAEGLGLEPDQALRELERAILRGDPSLDLPRTAEPSSLPSGTVTFLFTDVEGSTRLLHELGAERYADALANHRRVLREAFTAHGGVEVDTQGDGFFYAFARASDALAAAEEGQRELEGGPARVRMGIHTGEPLVTDEGYVGVDVHQAARVMGAAHGLQVLVSAATARLVEGVALHDLGPHRLKDLTAPQRLYQLGDESFPPLRTLYGTNLPVQPTPFLGRERELGEVLELLSSNRVRLLTLTGPGGSGKTRLALQAAGERAEAFEHGVWWVPLQAVTDPAFVVPTVAETLGADELAAHIGDRRLLLVLDNLEQVVEVAPQLAELLAACPHLLLLATSREPLHIEAEQEYAVPPLAEAEAIRFFLTRARAVDPGFSADRTVPKICVRLDCLPLALELAAARVKLMSSERLLERLDRALPLLTTGRRDAPARQQTLRATIGWSYDLLTDRERRLFIRLGVFMGGCTLEVAEIVAGADLDTLQSLIDKSLLRAEDDRFRMLETIHEYAIERLNEAGDATNLRECHLEHFLAFAEETFDKPVGPRRPEIADLRERERDNLRAALRFAVGRADAGRALRLAVVYGPGWITVAEWLGWLEAGLALDQDDVPRELLALARRRAGFTAFLAGQPERAETHLQEALETYRTLGDSTAVADILGGFSGIALERGDVSRARELLADALRLLPDVSERWVRTELTLRRAGLALHQGDLADARDVLARFLAEARSNGAVFEVARGIMMLADVERAEGRLDAADNLYHESLELGLAAGVRRTVHASISRLACIAAIRNDAYRAGRLWGAFEAHEREIGRFTLSERSRAEETLAVVAERDDFARGRAATAFLPSEDALQSALSDE
jgi:predicted ATPase/DNA-binding SARP family transcriptional activator